MFSSSYQDMMHTLQDLCQEKRSGIMTISGELGKTAKLILEQGEIFDVSYAGFSGKAALLQIRKISSGKTNFFKCAQEKISQKIHLSTPEILQILNDETEKQQHFIKTQLATLIGPVAQLIYEEYEKDILQANTQGMLNAVIHRIAQQTLSPEKQMLFKQHIATRKDLKLHPATLSLCIKKHSAHGELNATLLTKLATQIEQVHNLAEIIHLYDLLKFLEKTTKTGWLAISVKGEKAGFYFNQGVLINAFDDQHRHGMAVACDILHWQPDQMNFISMESTNNIPRQIHQTVDMLLVTVHTEILNKEQAIKRTTQLAMNALLINVHDGEIRQEIASIYETELRKKTLLPEYIKTELSKQIEQSKHENACQCLETECHTCLTKAIQLAESYDYSGAEQLMVRILWEQDHIYSAWFWLARILVSMTAIEFALKKAAYINIKSPELAEEVKKFTTARKTAHSDLVLRCPFCWTPVQLESSRCSYCSGDFFISHSSFVKTSKAKTEIIDEAIARYESALRQNSHNSNMIYTSFYLAMAYLNRQYYQEALAQLNEVVKLAPDNPVLLKQRELLIEYMRTLGLMSSMVKPAANTITAEKILVVEDSAVTRKVIVRTLQLNGYEVFEAKDAKEALASIVAKNPDMILLDIILPGNKDGYDILADIRKTPETTKVPVIMLTSRDSLFDKFKGKISDANEYLTKPFQPDELLRVVKKYLK